MDDPDGYFGEPVAASYDDPSDPMFQPETVEPAVSLLAELAGDGAALELAIGTGRIGLPLSQRGVPVHGIELSRAMVARLRGKPGGRAVSVTIGDMTTTRVAGAFTVAYLVFNTINNLTGPGLGGSSATALTTQPSGTPATMSSSPTERPDVARSCREPDRSGIEKHWSAGRS